MTVQRRTLLDEGPRRKPKICEHCRTEPALARKGAKYCSDRCRRDAYRSRLKAAAEAAGIPGLSSLAAVEKVAVQPETSRDASRPLPAAHRPRRDGFVWVRGHWRRRQAA